MTENAKTIAFVFAGLLAICVALFTRPAPAELDDESLIGADLTKSFDSPDAAKRLRIVRFNEDTATLREFEVAEEDGLWTIPSKDGYPADAARQWAEAATSLMDRTILAIAGRSAGDHEEYGVKDPLSPKLEVGAKGVGARVTMSDVHGQPLADLIVGKAVKDADGQRYVREAGRDMVYVIEIDPAKLSTNFEDWIEKDLLKLNAWDLQQVQIKDYSAEMHVVMTPEGRPGLGLSMDPRSEMSLAYNDDEAKWNAEKLQQFDTATESYSDVTLAEDEELNSQTLNALKTALDDLQIVDVVRKPQGLSNDLKAGADFMKNVEALQDLVSKGFIPARAPGGSSAEELISSDGEVIATMKDGAEYVLRFGNLTSVDGGGQENESESPAGEAQSAATNKNNDVHRYLFVMARFNESAVKEPELQEVPDVPAADKTEEASEPSGESAVDSSGEPASAGEDENNEAINETTGASNDAESAEQPASDENASTDDADAQNATETDAASESDTPDADSADTANDAATSESDDREAESDQADKDEGKADNDDSRQKLLAEQTRIVAENQRKQDDYEKLKEKGRETVKELNLRFGDWYFVVSDEVFKKIRLSREDVIKKKETDEEAGGESASADGTQSEAAAPPVTIPGLPPIPGTNE